MHIQDLDREWSAPILDIFNDAILNSTALWDYAPRSIETMEPWFALKEARRFPVVGMVGEPGQLAGFATYGTFRERPAYKYSIEHSVYVHKDHRGLGIGTQLLTHLIARARQQEYHAMVGGIEASNTASRELHRRLGFECCGTVRQAGFKFGRWLDLEFWQLLMQTPANPMDG